MCYVCDAINAYEKPSISQDDLDEVIKWSHKTFGPGKRTQGVISHIKKELDEIEADPTDISEWADVIILGFDGAWRSGHSPEVIIAAIKAKWAKNMARTWPDWRDSDENTPIEHDRSKD